MYKNLILASTLSLFVAHSVASEINEATYSNEEVTCLAAVIYHEARGESLVGKKAVGHVVLNRMSHKKFPDSVCGVVTQRTKYVCQFSWFCTKYTTKLTTELYNLAFKLLDGKTKDPTGGAIFFHTVTMENPFKRKKTAIIGNHIFYE
jgi:spore germination cell wall hydrolase CwlJ-like protein